MVFNARHEIRRTSVLLLRVRKKMRVKEKTRERDDLQKQTEPLTVSHVKVEYSAVMTVNIYTAFTRRYSKHFPCIYSCNCNNSPMKGILLLFPFYRRATASQSS